MPAIDFNNFHEELMRTTQGGGAIIQESIKYGAETLRRDFTVVQSRDKTPLLPSPENCMARCLQCGRIWRGIAYRRFPDQVYCRIAGRWRHRIRPHFRRYRPDRRERLRTV